MTHEIAAMVLVAGTADGPVIALDEPLSFWGGFDAVTGKIVDQRHPQAGRCLTDAVVVMRSGRGSSSASSVLAEAIRAGTAPAAIVMAERDEIVALGSIVADETYQQAMPVLVVEDPTAYRAAAEASSARIDLDGSILAHLDGTGPR